MTWLKFSSEPHGQIVVKASKSVMPSVEERIDALRANKAD